MTSYCILKFDAVQLQRIYVQINVYTNVPHTVHVLVILSKISKDILLHVSEHFRLIPRKYLRTFSLIRKTGRSYKEG